jgi:4-hydroxyproline epimerase
MKKTFFCIDAHTCGNPVRLVAGGGPLLQGRNMSEKRQHFLKEYDWIRTGLMFEPRGHDMMSGSILYPPHDPENDVAVLFIETSGCLPMCGHGTIGTITIAIEEGLLVPKTPGVVRMEAPAGLVFITYRQEGKKVASVKLTNVPSFLAAENITVECPDLGPLKVDVSYGGNFYAIVDVQEAFKDWSITPPGNSLPGVVRCANESTKPTVLFILMIPPSTVAHISYGRVLY